MQLVDGADGHEHEADEQVGGGQTGHVDVARVLQAALERDRRHDRRVPEHCAERHRQQHGAHEQTAHKRVAARRRQLLLRARVIAIGVHVRVVRLDESR